MNAINFQISNNDKRTLINASKIKSFVDLINKELTNRGFCSENCSWFSSYSEIKLTNYFLLKAQASASVDVDTDLSSAFGKALIVDNA
ncbi:unnamed protein product [Rotaria socialis]